MGDTFRSDNLSPVRGPVPSWTADPLHVEGDEPLAEWLDRTRGPYTNMPLLVPPVPPADVPWRVPAGWLVAAALLGLAAGLLIGAGVPR